MNVEGATQGPISSGANTSDSMGNKYQSDHADEITVIAYDHDVFIPRDPQSGQPVGRRVHGPVTIRKRFDKASPMLYQALCTGERLPTVEIHWFRTTMEGTQEHYFTHILEDALIVDIKGNMVLTTDVSQDYRDHEEEVLMTYRKITWKHEVAGTEGSDDWRTEG
jgi:type VI secretion system secreted protein Hcp